MVSPKLKAQTPTPPQPTPPSMGKITVVLTKENVDLLKRWAQEASVQGGRTISGSAILRALVRYAEKHGTAWQRKNILPVLEEEIASGTVWGTTKEVQAQSANPGKRPRSAQRRR